jgi:very-short-patch-repair endonuclease
LATLKRTEMDVRVQELAAAQADVVAAWQLRSIGWTKRMVVDHAQRNGWRRVHNGVYALSHAPLTHRQRWIAATLTAPGTVLSHASAGACLGFRRFDARYQTVTRPGSGGPRRLDGVLVHRSSILAGHTTIHENVPITTAARTLCDIAAHAKPWEVARAFREAVRLKLTTAVEVHAVASRHRGRGTRHLRELALRYGTLAYARTRSNAEARALEVLADAGVQLPKVNVRIAGEEADLVWCRQRLIIEIDGPQYHQFADEDARKEACWRRAGYTVRRISSDLVYGDPARLVALVDFVRAPVSSIR